MIIAFFLECSLKLAGLFVPMFPLYSVPTEIAQGLGTLAEAAMELNTAIPIAEMFIALGIYLSAWGIVMLVRTTIFLYKLIPLT